jgi:hypothetical protein
LTRHASDSAVEAVCRVIALVDSSDSQAKFLVSTGAVGGLVGVAAAHLLLMQDKAATPENIKTAMYQVTRYIEKSVEQYGDKVIDNLKRTRPDIASVFEG